MEDTIASLEDQLTAANEERDAATSRAESLAFDFQSLSDELSLSNSELCELKEELSSLRTSLEESRSHALETENSIKKLLEEKEELSMQFTVVLLAMEEEKAIWSSKERASVEFVGEKEKSFAAEINLLSSNLLEARNELEICRKNCKDHEQLLKRLDENAALEKQYTNRQSVSDDRNKRSPEISNSQVDSKSQETCEEIELLQLELSGLRKERQYLLAQVQELEGRRRQQQQQQPVSPDDSRDRINSNINKEMAKLRMRLRGTQANLDTLRVRYRESVDELDYMRQRFEEASAKLKKQIASLGLELLNLKKEKAGLKVQ